MTEAERARIDFPARIGVWWASETWSMPDAQEVAREIEALGFGSLFLPEVTGKECLTQSAAFLAATQRLVVGTGIANIHVRVPSAAETGARTLTALYPGRFVLGLGVSHGPLVEHGLGGVYQKPLATMRDYLDRMAAVPEQIEPGVGRPPRLLAALGPKMIELSGTHADGAHPYLVTPEQTRVTRDILGAGKWIVSEQAVAIGSTDDDQLRRAHAHLDVYSGLPNYRNSWLRQGFDESDLVRGGSDRLARAVVGMGSVESAAKAVTAHLDAGADHVVLQVLGDNPMADPRPALRELAGALGLR
ncbi:MULTISPECIES: LLM class F420-dependent oxidoreductase [unclassified Mycolicibacterium]|uniref:LLM class F420-dependent oxidoreductase n=1 Tax=unclassified Mycolicibacterium TaxID=2636767 RepID=UPI0012DD3FB3|nr:MULTISPECIES: LLM class F420-dependent oxidoreductase [unclassified Mycolicibacterium]MUL81983.1 LLM class F420-dependent oxidoreductase [Mycolicibacterium sp. CBMA 329]MUL87749.1 LLM class F420-dependent oxidoreductase [Mycolicibacterium sp. CBMA 331]MUL99388.1 LLM class F420-dependent oxidoreductase [Mycolicibacterium sp. CBMA 334]MUM29358.1 LLM class F420-dependent oxidoreductase [Mycolicibacterium sp. CBMA 295]MUM38046.1 LLM class F420-dependent oxidoreductase [Mycolicibacterium sp. CBM